MRYIVNILISIDQLFTSILGGYPDETLSSYVFRLDQKRRFFGRLFRPMIDFLFMWQGHEFGHCYEAHREERLRYQFPPDLR